MILKTAQFQFDVFVSHSSRDKPIARSIAERLRSDGLVVWFDEWDILVGDSIPAKVEHGLEHSRILLLCMSKHAFGSDWALLEASTFRFRDPLNKERRFLPLLLDDARIPGSLAQFLYVDWRTGAREVSYSKLLDACRAPAKLSHPEPSEGNSSSASRVLQLEHPQVAVLDCAISADGTSIITCASDRAVRLWDLSAPRAERLLGIHERSVHSLGPSVVRATWSGNHERVLSSGEDGVRMWYVKTGKCLRFHASTSVRDGGGYSDTIYCLAWEADERRLLTGGAIRLWDVQTGNCLRVLEGHTETVRCVSWQPHKSQALSGGDDDTIRLWNTESGRTIRILEGHTDSIRAVVWSFSGSYIASASNDYTARVWDLKTGKCLRVLAGHEGMVVALAMSADQQLLLTGSLDASVRVWSVKSGRCIRVLQSPAGVRGVAWRADAHVVSCDVNGCVRIWDLSDVSVDSKTADTQPSEKSLAPLYVQYTNAKVLLVGESGAGKTGLTRRLALNEWYPTDSTVGAWATQWKLGVSPGDDIEREIWLWDFGGQADQRLVHQLYTDDTALAVLVFDGQKENVFEALSQWDRDLSRVSHRSVAKLLVAGRVDAGGVRVSRGQIDAFTQEHNYTGFIETSAKLNSGCDELRQKIFKTIQWEQIPWRSAPLLFKRLKEEIIRLKDDGRILMRFNEVRNALLLRLSGESVQFTDEELAAVIGLLTGPGVVWELKFGSWVLLQPERINLYAQAVIRTIRSDSHERGCLNEERVLKGDLEYNSSCPRPKADDERFVLLAMHQMLIERGLCLREHTDQGTLLIFPSYYRRERPALIEHPAVLVGYRFTGFLDEIYATLVVRLHHSRPFRPDQLWRDAADFRTLTGKQLGIKMNRQAEGAGELELYFDRAIPTEEKIIFCRYAHEHLVQKARDVVRLRHYVCPHCGTTVGNHDVATRRLDAWLEGKADLMSRAQQRTTVMGQGASSPTIICSECERRVPLWDEFEQCFSDPSIKHRVRKLQEEYALVLDNESKERALVGEVISTVALAGQICREFNVSDHGIDMELEFKSDDGEATGRKVYLQLKSGDSYLRARRGGVKVFEVKNERHARYWVSQAFPVMLILRTKNGEIRWINICDKLKRASLLESHLPRSVIFDGVRFDVMAVRGWRDIALGKTAP
jgi:small GTP-binding protein